MSIQGRYDGMFRSQTSLVSSGGRVLVTRTAKLVAEARDGRSYRRAAGFTVGIMDIRNAPRRARAGENTRYREPFRGTASFEPPLHERSTALGIC